jgi:tryptophan synthase beta subunit
VIRTTPENAVLAQQLVLAQKPASESPSNWMTTTTALTDFAGNVSTIDGGRLHKSVAESHEQLRPKQTTAITAQFQVKTREGFQALARTEGLLPALEPSHVIGWLLRRPLPEGSRVLVCLSGRGDKDLDTVLRALGSTA